MCLPRNHRIEYSSRLLFIIKFWINVLFLNSTGQWEGEVLFHKVIVEEKKKNQFNLCSFSYSF